MEPWSIPVAFAGFAFLAYHGMILAMTGRRSVGRAVAAFALILAAYLWASACYLIGADPPVEPEGRAATR